MSIAQVQLLLGEVLSQQQLLKVELSARWNQHQRRNIKPTACHTACHQTRAVWSPKPQPRRDLTLPHDRKIIVDQEELDYILRFLRFLENLALLLQRTLQFLLTCSKFGRFPNRQRPRCTTMPWSIWPSLVVLWGVCWMFYTPFTTLDATRFESYFDDEQLSLSVPGKTSHVYISIENIDGRVVELAFDPAFASYPSGFEHFPGNFETEIEFNDATYASHIDQKGPKDYNLKPFEHQFVAQVSSENIVGSRSSADLGSRLNETPSSTTGHMNESTQQIADVPRSQLYMNGSQSTNTSQTIHHDEQHIASSSAVAMTAPTGSETMLPQEASTESEQLQGPPRNAEGKLICTHFGCDRNQIFKRHSDWQ
jgi:hypothetical protein